MFKLLDALAGGIAKLFWIMVFAIFIYFKFIR